MKCELSRTLRQAPARLPERHRVPLDAAPGPTAGLGACRRRSPASRQATAASAARRAAMPTAAAAWLASAQQRHFWHQAGAGLLENPESMLTSTHKKVCRWPAFAEHRCFWGQQHPFEQDSLRGRQVCTIVTMQQTHGCQFLYWQWCSIPAPVLQGANCSWRLLQGGPQLAPASPRLPAHPALPADPLHPAQQTATTCLQTCRSSANNCVLPAPGMAANSKLPGNHSSVHECL